MSSTSPTSGKAQLRPPDARLHGAEPGRDIAYYIDGVPVNGVSSLHAPNYADLNILWRVQRFATTAISIGWECELATM